MPVAYALNETGELTTMRAYVLETSGRDPGEIRHIPLTYVGTFDTALGQFRGEWRFAEVSQGHGTWWMAKNRL